MSHATTGAAARPREAALLRLRGIAPLVAAVLASCGGGSSPDAAPDAADAAPERRSTLGADTWTQIAGEGQSFSVSGTQTVRFGNTWYGWVQKSVTGGGSCSIAFFGSDPAPGRGKACEVLGTTTVTTTTTPPPTTGTWTTIANEGQSFAVSGTQTVRYGDPWAAWITATVSGNGQCTNSFFGSDPAPGKGKRCDVLSSSAPAAAPAPAPAPAPSPGTWTQVASEGQSFTLASAQTVRFGNRWLNAWVQKSASGTNPCSVAFFGSDPAPGQGKTCEANGTTPVAASVASTWSVIGSSTAQGVGATPGHSWVELMSSDNASRGVSVVGLGVGGSVTYNGLSASAAVAGKPAPDTAHNVDAALAPGAKVVFINYPSNDVAYGYTSDETVANHLSMRDAASRAGAVTIALSSQPQRGVPSAWAAATFADSDRRLAAAFGPCFVPIRAALGTSNDTLNPIYDSGDGQHLNDAGHALVYSLVKSVLTSGLCVKP